jgi:hypothetical protein
MKRCLLISFAIISFILLSFVNPSYAALAGKVSLLEGRVDVLKTGKNAAAPVKAGDPVDVGDIYRAKSDGRAEITFMNGNTLKIAPNTRAEIKEAMFEGNKNINIIKLYRGRVQAISSDEFVKKVSAFAENNKFEVHTPNAVAGIRGSNMIVSYIRAVTGTLFTKGLGYQFNPNDPQRRIVSIIGGTISFVATATGSPTMPRIATSTEITLQVNAVTTIEQPNDGGNQGGQNSGGGSSGGTSGSGTSGSGTSGSGTGTTTTNTGTAGATTNVSGTFDANTTGITVNTTTTTTTTITNTPTIINNNIVTPPPPSPEPTPTVAGFNSTLVGGLLTTFYGQGGDGQYFKPGAPPADSYKYRYHYIQTDPGRRGYGSYEIKTTGYETVMTDGGVINTHRYKESTGTEYEPDWTKIIHTDNPVTHIISNTTLPIFDVTTLSNPPLGYQMTLNSNIQEYWTNTPEKNGTLTGSLIGTENPWDGPVPFTLNADLLPDHNLLTTGPNLFGAEVKSYNDKDNTNTTYDGGAYAGGIFGVGGFNADNVGSTGGGVYLVYIGPDNRAGVLEGGYNGSLDGVANKISASGTIAPIVFNNSITGVTPLTLMSNLDYGFIGGDFRGNFGTWYSGINGGGWGQTLSILGQTWGIFGINFGVYSWFSNPDSSTAYQGRATGWAEFGSYKDNNNTWQKNTGFFIAGVNNGTATPVVATGGKLDGDMDGTFYTYTMMGNITGNIYGSYHDGIASPSWLAEAAGYWYKTQHFDFAGRVDHGGSTRYAYMQSGSYNYLDGSYYNYSYLKDAQIGHTQLYWNADGTNTQRNYSTSPGGNSQYDESKYSVSDGTMTPASISFISSDSGPYGSDISTIKDLRPDGFSASGGPNDSYEFLGTNDTSTSNDVAIMGGVGNLWSATQSAPVPVYFAGQYTSEDKNDQLPYLYSARVTSYNPYLDNYTSALGGAYTGIIASIMNQQHGVAGDTVEKGMIGLVYINGGNAGIITGDFTGKVMPGDEAWEATGTAYPIEIVQGIGIAPENLTANIQTVMYNITPSIPLDPSRNIFVDAGGAPIGIITTKDEQSRSVYINGQDWGIKFVRLGGTYSGTTSDVWNTFTTWQYTSTSFSEIMGRGIHGTKWSGDRIEGRSVGYRGWISAADYGVMIASGKIEGTFNPAVNTWQAIGLSAYFGVDQFLAMQATVAGVDALTKLNIPCVEVGTATLTGSGNGFDALSINNARFFSTTGSGTPMLWAAGGVNGVTGTYSSTPSVNVAIPLSGSGLSADFVPVSWDTGNNKWLASVRNGTGNLSGGSYNGPVKFGGAAAGNIIQTSPTTGSINGLAGGAASKP